VNKIRSYLPNQEQSNQYSLEQLNTFGSTRDRREKKQNNTRLFKFYRGDTYKSTNPYAQSQRKQIAVDSTQKQQIY
jgi:hypothetical protein